VVNAAEPDDNQIAIARACRQAARRDESHRFLASQPCCSSLQAGNYLALISGPIPVIRPASASISVIIDLPSLVTGLVIGPHLQVTQPDLQDL
jgi:hypothetical protein